MTITNQAPALRTRSTLTPTFPKRRLADAVRLGSSTLVSAALLWHGSAFAQSEVPDEPLLEEIVVSGQRSSIQSAQLIKQNAEQIVDSIVADDIGKLPDRSVTETLQRIPGVTIERFIDIGDPEHFAAEGSGVAVRGMKHVRSELNGRDTFSASGGRSLSFEDVPAELMAGVDVYKNPSADMIEGGIGGTVDLRTRMPFDSDGQVISGSVSANYGDFIEEVDPSASILYSNRWETGAGEFGALVDFAYSEISTRTDGIFLRPFFARTDILDEQTAWIPRGADWRRMDFNRERLGSYGAFQWRPNEDQEFYFTIFRSEYDMQWDEDAIFVDNDPWAIQLSEDSQFNEDGVFQSGTLSNSEPPAWSPQTPGIPFGADIRVSTRNSVTTDYAAGWKWNPSNRWEFSTEFQYTDSTTDTLDSTVATGISLESLTVNAAAEPPKISTDESYLAEPTNYYWAFAMPHIEDSKAEQFAWRGDTEFFVEDSVIKSVKAGVRVTNREADNINTGYDWQAIFASWMTTDWGGGLNINDLGMPYMEDSSQMSLNTFDDFFRGDADLTGVVWAPKEDIALGYPDSYVDLYAEAADYADSLGHPYSETYGDYQLRDPNDPQWRNLQSEDTYAAYGLVRFGFDELPMPIDGNIGVRYVDTRAQSDGFLVYPDLAPYGNGQMEPLSVSNDYDNVLPSLNLRMTITEDLIARFAASKAMSRPSFSEMQAYQMLEASIDEETGNVDLSAGSWNNPHLKPLESDQLDLSLEYYFDDAGGMAHLNLFYKDIEGIVRSQTVTEQYPDLNATMQDYTVTRPVNAGSAEIQGFEVGYNQFFDFLPEPFDGLGMQANYTYIDSSTDIPNSIDPDTGALIAPVDTDGTLIAENLPYEGLSENAYNLVGMYEKDKLSIRLAWSWRDEYLMSVGANGFNGDNGGVDSSAGDSGDPIFWKLPVYSDATGQLDGSIFYDINDSLSIGLEANNLTNEQTRTIMQQSAQGAGRHNASYFVNDTRYALTLRANF
ncbi:TonB-dependent receptor [Marinimicrobium locisalis]|uniref:TonB-dependent receptor n=1 Tax=Marinimicrobium locisalis TaxID=546022 RepID=UPI0032221CC1